MTALHPLWYELAGLQRRHPVEVRHLVEGAVEGPLSGRTVVADDVVDDRVVEDSEVVDGVDQPADVMVDVLEEPGVHLHLTLQYRLEIVGHVIPCGDLGVTSSELGVRRDDPQLLLASEGALSLNVPTVSELTRVPAG